MDHADFPVLSTASQIPLLVYHGTGCPDGFSAAFSAWYSWVLRRGGRMEFVASDHGDPPPASGGREVFLLDYAYKRPAMEHLCNEASRVVVLDHHISAAQDLAGLDEQYPNLELRFDMERSGAVIAWEYFNEEPVPALLAHVQDRDLWQWRLPYTADITAGLMSQPMEFEQWLRYVEEPELLKTLKLEGRAINRYREQEIDAHVPYAVTGEIAGYRVPIVNAPRGIRSELLNRLAEGQPFAAGYTDEGERRVWSLRSKPEGLNVAEIAARFGGGGHARAAGFATAAPAYPIRLEPGKS